MLTPTINVSPGSSQTYCLDVTDVNGCTTNTLCVNLTLFPPLSLQPLTDQLICDGDSLTLSANVSGGDGGPYTYLWDQGLGSGQTHVVNPSVSTTYSVSVTDGCESPAVSSSATITVSPIPFISFTADVLEGCYPVEVNFYDLNVPAGSSCNWSFGDGGSSSNCDSVAYTFFAAGCWDVSLDITTSDGCLANYTEPQYVCVHDYPTASFSFTPQPTTLLNTQINFNNFSSGASIYNWTFDVNGTPAYSTQEHPIYIFSDAQPGSYEVCLEAVNDYGCTDVTCRTVEINDVFLVYVPNAFTPGNEDNINDVFLPVVNGVDFQEFEFFIFNRWGELIFESYRIEEGWDGTYKGKIAKQDAYVWKLSVVDQLTNQIHQYSGSVILLGKQQ